VTAAAPTVASAFFNLHGDDANEPRVELDLDNATVREGLKQVLDKAKQAYKVDDDVPNTARITVRAKNVRLSTALELLLQDAGLGIVRQVEDGKLVYRIRKSGSDTLSTLDLLRSTIDNKLGMTLAPGHLQQFLTIKPDGKWIGKTDPKALELHLRSLQEFASKQGAAGALPYVIRTQERRSLFKCPHCKGQATVIRHPEQPKCEKCSSVFQPGWQFCPADGAKRPAAVGEWKYCPFCSKKVEGEKGASIPVLGDIPILGSLFQIPAEPGAPAFQAVPAPTAPSAPAFRAVPAPVAPSAPAFQAVPAPVAPRASVFRASPVPVAPGTPAVRVVPVPGAPSAPALRVAPRTIAPRAPAAPVAPTPSPV